MNNLAKNLDASPATQDSGNVVLREGDTLVVRNARGDYKCRRAASCLVQPEVGDFVLLATVPEAGSYVLAVLERGPEARNRIVLEGDLEIALPSGRFGIAARDGVDLVTGAALALVSRAVTVSATEGSVLVDRLSHVGSVIDTQVDKLKTFARTADSVFERVTQRVKRSFRTVEEFDQLKAGQIDYTATGHVNVRGETALVSADQLVKVDAAQVHVG